MGLQNVSERSTGRITAVRIERVAIVLACLIALAALAAFAISIVAPRSLDRLGLHQGDPASSSALSGSVAADLDRAEEALFKGDVDAAKRLSAQAMTRDSTDAQADFRAGNVALRAGDAAAARADYSLGESADRRNPWNFVALGQLYAREGKLAQADAQLRAASASGPSLQFLHYDLGAVELREGLYAAALADFEAELRSSPAYAPARAGRAIASARLAAQAKATSQGTIARRGDYGAGAGPSHGSIASIVLAAGAKAQEAVPQLVTVRAYPIPMPLAGSQGSVPNHGQARPARRHGPLTSITAIAAPAAASRPPWAATPGNRPPWAAASSPYRARGSGTQGSAADPTASAPAAQPVGAPAVGAPTPVATMAEGSRQSTVRGLIPDTIGMTVEEAIVVLKNAGLGIDHITLLPGGTANSRIVNTEPEPGATTPPGSYVVNLILGKPSNR